MNNGERINLEFPADRLANYVEGLPKNTLKVQCLVTYHFFKVRTYSIRSIGEFEYHPNGTSLKTAGDNLGQSCFPWLDTRILTDSTSSSP